MVKQSSEDLPLDTRLLSNAVIELNISKRVVSLYPGNHGLVEAAVARAFQILEELFELRAEIALAVAKDRLIVDNHRLDPGNPVFTDFALSLSRLGIACLTFVKGLTIEEVSSFQRFLTRDSAGISAEKLPEVLKEYNLFHILVKPIDYEDFAFREGSTDLNGADQYMVQRYIKGLLEGTLLTTDVAEVIDALPPEVLAGLLSSADPGNVEEKAYDTVITGYLRRTGGPTFSGKDLGRLLTLISKLRPELKRQFLGSSVKALGGDLTSLRTALEGVSVDKIVELLESLEEHNIVIPEPVRNILSKFSYLAEEVTPSVPEGMENLADDIILSPDIMNILRGEQDRPVMSETYRREMQNLTKADLSGLKDSLSISALPEFDNDSIRYWYGQTLLEIISSAPGLSDPVEGLVYADLLSHLADEIASAGQYSQLYELIITLRGNINAVMHPQIVRSVLEHCNTLEFISHLSATFKTHGRKERGAAMFLCGYYGEKIVPFLYDLVSTEESTATRRFIIDTLVRMGDTIIPESRRRIADRRWYVRRNVLYILGESGAAKAVPTLRVLSRDEDPRVRLEAAKCLIKTGDPEGVECLRDLMLKGEGRVADAAVALAGTLKVTKVLPDLVYLVRKKVVDGPDYQIKISVVRALGQIGAPETAIPLRELLSGHSILYGGSLKKLKAETLKALQHIEREEE